MGDDWHWGFDGFEMKEVTYTPGYSATSRNFMAERGASTHGAFFFPYLRDGACLLDCGCGPGTITVGLAERIPQGKVVGVDRSPEQVAEARRIHRSIANVRFEVASVYQLPFDDGSFDLVFSHALLEHVASPSEALRELHRVLKPGGTIGLCSPDFAAFVISPVSPQIEAAFGFYRSKQESNGGNTLAGRYLMNWLVQAGFEPVVGGGRCENYPDPVRIGEYLAHQLDADAPDHAAAFRDWMRRPGALFAQMWIHCVGRKV